MSKATTLPSHHRINNYVRQSLCVHKFVERNCPTYMSPKQIRRVYKKTRRAYKVKNFSAPF